MKSESFRHHSARVEHGGKFKNSVQVSTDIGVSGKEEKFLLEQWRCAPDRPTLSSWSCLPFIPCHCCGWKSWRKGQEAGHSAAERLLYYVREVLEPVSPWHEMTKWMNHCDADADTAALHFWSLLLQALEVFVWERLWPPGELSAMDGVISWNRWKQINKEIYVSPQVQDAAPATRCRLCYLCVYTKHIMLEAGGFLLGFVSFLVEFGPSSCDLATWPIILNRVCYHLLLIVTTTSLWQWFHSFFF